MDTDAVLDLMKEAAESLIVPRFRALSAHQVQEKEPGDLVTVADREAEAAITARLTRAYPDALIVGEEACAADPRALGLLPDSEHAFTVDPVDGTRAFVDGLADYAVMVGELRDGVPVRGWIWLPERGVAYVAEQGGGVYRNGNRLEPAPRASDPAALRGGSWALEGVAPGALAALQAPPWSAGVAYVHVLTGLLDYMLFRKDWPWDHVPGSLMLAELGGRTGWLDGVAYDTRQHPGWLLAAGSPQIHEIARGAVAAALPH